MKIQIKIQNHQFQRLQITWRNLLQIYYKACFKALKLKMGVKNITARLLLTEAPQLFATLVLYRDFGIDFRPGTREDI